MSPEDAAAKVEKLELDFRDADLSSREIAILEYAIKLTQSPAEMIRDDVESLKSHGLDDLAIHDLCAATAYFAFANRIADGLGVELESASESGAESESE